MWVVLSGVRISSPHDIFALVKGDFSNDSEKVELVMLDSMCNVLAKEIVSEGSENSAPLHPRQVLAVALRYPTVFIVLVHNHPKGCVEPSEEDIEVTRKIAKAGKMVGVYLLDHLIIGNGKFFSFLQQGLISPSIR
ncbi:MAG: JAB domain-containing protein [Candidatus Hadarchaeales archaeon]